MLNTSLPNATFNKLSFRSSFPHFVTKFHRDAMFQ
jgi:hypothetical protein